MKTWPKMKQKNYRKLHKTYFIWYSFWKNENITNFVNVWMLEDPIQKPTTVTCGPFQLYFYENLFFPDKNSKLHSYKKLTNTALETFLNKLFTLKPENNEQTINEYIKQWQINMIWPTLTALSQSTILVYLKLLALDRFSLCAEKKQKQNKITKKHKTSFGKG